MPTLFAQIGAEKLREVLTDFYRRVFSDVMIGFLFLGKDQQRLIDKEWEFTAQLLGGDVRYTGRPIAQAHAQSPILGGHFARRLQILKDTLGDHHISEAVQTVWIEHTLSLRNQVTKDRGTDCDHSQAAGKQPKV